MFELTNNEIILIGIIIVLVILIYRKRENMEDNVKPLCGPESDPVINCDANGLPVCGPHSASKAKCCGPSHRDQEPCPMGQCCSSGGVCGGELGSSNKDEFCSECDIKPIKVFGTEIGATVENCRGGFRDISYDGTSKNINKWQAIQAQKEAERNPKNIEAQRKLVQAVQDVQNSVQEQEE